MSFFHSVVEPKLSGVAIKSKITTSYLKSALSLSVVSVSTQTSDKRSKQLWFFPFKISKDYIDFFFPFKKKLILLLKLQFSFGITLIIIHSACP